MTDIIIVIVSILIVVGAAVFGWLLDNGKILATNQQEMELDHIQKELDKED